MTQKIDRTTAKDPLIIAKQILWMRRDQSTTPMHILKQVYLCHGWLLGLASRTLIHEPVEAWQYGPVIPSVYHTYKIFRGDPVSAEPEDHGAELDDFQKFAITLVDAAYGHLTAVQLSALTHRPGTPWDVTQRTQGFGAIINDALILDHFSDLKTRFLPADILNA